MDHLAKLLRKGVNRLGYDLHGVNSNPNPFYQLLKGLARFEIDLVLDVGANIGQFAMGLRDAGYHGTLVSFEPLSAAYLELVKAAQRDDSWIIHHRGAIGDHTGEVEINIAGNSVSSSVLPMTEAHLSVETKSAYIGIEKAPIFTIDSVSPKYLDKSCRPFLKIDTQGFEWQVLDGAQETLPHIQGILCELSLVPLYEGQHLWLDIISRLEREGFMLWSIQKGLTDLRDGRTLQLDAIFFRAEV